MTMRWLPIAMVLLVSPSANAETLRVAVANEADRVTVSSTQGLEWLGPSSAARRLSVPLVIVPAPSGLSIVGEKIHATEIRIRPLGEGFLVVEHKRLRGELRLLNRNGKIRVINLVDLEEYLRGVVPSEVPHEWPEEALMAQAIAARTYALRQREQNTAQEYDLSATVRDQVYSGVEAETPRTDAAVRDTEGRVITYNGELIQAAYHSTSAGFTEDAKEVWGEEIPYLRGVSCPFDEDSPYYEWERGVGPDRLEEALRAAGYRIGTLATLTPFDWTDSGRVGRLRVLHSEGELLIRGDDLRRVLGYRELPSTRFDVGGMGRELRIRGNGYGHGVGLCQWGSKKLAERGYTADQILRYYYPGVKVTSIR
jgi:stage II sporulation protein D